MTRTDIINQLIKKNNYKSYLEIGCQNDINFNAIECNRKVGVDPERGGTLRMTSDQYFNSPLEYFDIIFIDGLHENMQVYKDIVNSLSRLNKDGIIICHDMNPQSELAQKVPREVKIWNGDCWLAWIRLRLNNSELTMRVVDTDHGCGVIQKGQQELLNINKLLTYQNLELNRKEWLNLITIEDFKKLYL